MKDLAEISYIKYQYEVKGKSLRAIARETGMNFRTVKKYAQMNNFNVDKLPNVEPQNYPALGSYIEKINQWLLTDMSEPRKQNHTKMHIYNRLVKEEGYTGSYSSVRRYVAKAEGLIRKDYQIQKGSNQLGFLPLTTSMAHSQIDFGKFEYEDGLGIRHMGNGLVVSFPASNAGWLQVFPAENQECLLSGLKSIFNHIGGVPKVIKADNMTTAVASIPRGAGKVESSVSHGFHVGIGNKERILTDGFHRFMLHYRFQSEFCNPDSGHEKGNVENKVGYTRRNMLVPIPIIDDFDIFNKELLLRCDNDHQRKHYKHDIPISELWEEEQEHLLKLPTHDYEVFRYEALAVNKYGLVTIDTNKYGISPEYFGKIIQAKVFYDKVELYYDHSLLKTYARSYGKNQEVMDWKHYLPTLVHKPGGLEHTRFYDQLPKLWRQHLECTRGKERKTALMVLSEIIGDGNEEFCDEVLTFAMECGRVDSDSIRQCYYMVCKAENHPKPVVLSTTPTMLYYKPNLAAYDILTGGVVNE